MNVSVKAWMAGVPARWYRSDVVSKDIAAALLKDSARVAQKCTGSAKKPVFLFDQLVVKGPWSLPEERARLNCELGRSALMRAWAMPDNACPVLTPSLYAHALDERVYLVTPALHLRESASQPWVVEARCHNVSAVGPRQLEVISRASTGVVRVSDRARVDPDYLLKAPEVWEHLFHRCLLMCGDSGLHNMLVRPADDHAVGIDLDEQRNTAREDPASLFTLLFKAAPAKKLMPHLLKSLKLHQRRLEKVLERLLLVCASEDTNELLAAHELKRGNYEERIGWLQNALKAQSGTTSM